MTWSKDGSTSLPEGATAGNDGALRIEGRSNQIDGRYNLDVTNAYGRVSTPVTIRWREACKSHASDDEARHAGTLVYLQRDLPIDDHEEDR